MCVCCVLEVYYAPNTCVHALFHDSQKSRILIVSDLQQCTRAITVLDVLRDGNSSVSAKSPREMYDTACTQHAEKFTWYVVCGGGGAKRR